MLADPLHNVIRPKRRRRPVRFQMLYERLDAFYVPLVSRFGTLSPALLQEVVKQREHGCRSALFLSCAAGEHELIKPFVRKLSVGAEIESTTVNSDAPGVTVTTVPGFRIAGHVGTFQKESLSLDRAS